MPLFPVRRKFTNVPAHVEHLHRHGAHFVMDIVMDLKTAAIELRHTETKYRVRAQTNLH